MQWLNYHHLYYFWRIAKEGGVAKAARELRLGQPTLSTQLKQFEHYLGHSLFIRQGRSLTLTEEGMVAFRYAEDIFKLGSEFLEVLGGIQGSGRLELRLGTLDSVPKSMLLEIVQYAHEMFDCKVTILEGHGHELFRSLSLHELDIVVADHIPVKAEYGKLYSRSIRRSAVAIFGAAKFKGLRKDFPKSLQHQPHIVPTFHSKLHHDLLQYFDAHGVVPKMIAETQDTSTQKLFGVHGLGVIALPVFAARELVRKKALYEIGLLSGVKQEIWLVSQERRVSQPVAKALLARAW